MADDWRGIPGNEHAFARLRETLASGNAIGFVGAGASAGLYPLWSGLIRLLAQEAVDQGFASEQDKAFWLDPATKPQQAVRGIKQVLGTGTYADVLRDRFAPRRGADGNFFTPIHRCVLQLPFRGIVTTNYDECLLEARKQTWPAGVGAGFATWKDHDAVNQWLTRKVYAAGACPILFAHGYYERSDTIVLCADEYRDAYRSDGPFTQLMKALWAQEQLVFVGFGFSDPWLDFMAETALGPTGARTTAAPRHFAIVGLSRPYTPQLRATFRDTYNVVPLFYPVAIAGDGSEDHSALLALLEALTGAQAEPDRGHTPAGEGGAASSPHPEEAASSSLCHQRDLLIDLLQQSDAYLRTIEKALHDEFARNPKGAAEVVNFFAQCAPSNVQDLFIAVRIALQSKEISALQTADRQRAEKAAAALYCLAACRLVDEAAVRASLANRSGELEYLMRLNSDEPLICGIIATAVFGGELHLVASDNPALPRPQYGFRVSLPAGGDILESDFERAAYLALFENDREATELSLNAKPLDDLQRKRLEARLRTLQRVRRVNLVFIVTSPGAPQACRGFANRNRVPIAVPDTLATAALLGMDPDTLRTEVEEFWSELTQLRDTRGA